MRMTPCRSILLSLLLSAVLLAGCGARADSVPPAASSTSDVPEVSLPAPETEQELPAPEETAPLPESEPPAAPPPTPEETEPEEASSAKQPETAEEPEAPACIISISCAVILEHLEQCPPEKVSLVPEDGWILPPTEMTFEEGESVFQVLQRVCRDQRIHMEYTDTPLYDSAYIEGIHNLYEFDVGPLSGWMYSVNDWFPNYGCSKYALEDGDVVCWVYTCDQGADVGGGAQQN